MILESQVYLMCNFDGPLFHILIIKYLYSINYPIFCVCEGEQGRILLVYLRRGCNIMILGHYPCLFSKNHNNANAN